MKTIEIGGKLRPVLYGINALAEFNEGTGTDLSWIFKTIAKPLGMNMNQVRWLIYVGLKQGAQESNLPVDFTVDDVGKWLDKDFHKFPEFMEAVRDGMPSADNTKKK
jgi:hypothetical protein